MVPQGNKKINACLGKQLFGLRNKEGGCNPEIIKAVIAQFPEFARSAKDTAGGFVDMLRGLSSDNSESEKRYYDMCDVQLASSALMLQSEEYSFEQKQWIIGNMDAVRGDAARKGSEGMRCREAIAEKGSAVVWVLVGGMVAALWGERCLRSDRASR